MEGRPLSSCNAVLIEVSDFVSAWNKVMNPDRFDLA